MTFEALIALREGRRNDVYRDSLGKLTVGVGHLVVPNDHFAFGFVLSDVQVDALLRQDSAPAIRAAMEQALEAGITALDFLPYLASVNFQLGTKWTKKFPKTWKMIVEGEYVMASKALKGTIWARQTPVRVQDFQDALERLPATI